MNPHYYFKIFEFSRQKMYISVHSVENAIQRPMNAYDRASRQFFFNIVKQSTGKFLHEPIISKKLNFPTKNVHSVENAIQLTMNAYDRAFRQFFFNFFFCFIRMKISNKLCVTMDGTQILLF